MAVIAAEGSRGRWPLPGGPFALILVVTLGLAVVVAWDVGSGTRIQIMRPSASVQAAAVGELTATQQQQSRQQQTQDTAEPQQMATSGQNSATANSVQQVIASKCTRVPVADSDWGRAMSAVLSQWRSTLFKRMADFYKRVEQVSSRNGSQLIDRVEPQGLSRYDLFNPFVTCASGNQTRLGPEGDGGKEVCWEPDLEQPGCVIYSLGSRGDFRFEMAVLQATPCEVHTFDCNFDGTSQAPRHHYHKICIGNPGGSTFTSDAKLMSYSQITAMLNHTRVELLKMDIEGFEFDVISDFNHTCTLPMQLAMEIHFSKNILYDGSRDTTNFDNLFWTQHDVSLGELAVFFLHLADLGYGVISREDNIPWGVDCCAEFSFVRVEQQAECR